MSDKVIRIPDGLKPGQLQRPPINPTQVGPQPRMMSQERLLTEYAKLHLELVMANEEIFSLRHAVQMQQAQIADLERKLADSQGTQPERSGHTPKVAPINTSRLPVSELEPTSVDS